MKSINYYIIYIVFLSTFMISCSTAIPHKSMVKYYEKNKQTILRIEGLYNRINSQKPLAAEFSDNDFNYISLEMKTDSLRYIYEFEINEKRMCDTLLKFGYDTSSVVKLVRDMKSIKCTWINNLSYYPDGKKQQLIYMSIRPKPLDLQLSQKKYYILTFYKQPQYYDAEGRLLDKRNRKRLRKVNNEYFYRINDRVCYTISTMFR